MAVTCSTTLNNISNILDDDTCNSIYYSSEFNSFVNMVTNKTNDYNDLLLLKPGNPDGLYYRLNGVMPSFFGVAYIPSVVFKQNFVDSLLKVFALYGSEVKHGNILDVSEVKGRLKGEYIINNSIFELDLSSLNIAVDYKIYAPTDSFIKDYVLNYKNIDELATGDNNLAKSVVVARVNITMDLCFPYSSVYIRRITNSYGHKEKLTYTYYHWLVK